MAGSDGLICSHFTLAGSVDPMRARFGFAERVAAAAAAGFAGIGWLGVDYALARAAGTTDAELAAVLTDHEMVVAEVEFLTGWAAGPEDPDRRALGRVLEDQVWAMADAFAPRVVSVGELVGADELPPFDVVVERFAGLCDRAAAHGLLVALEFLPWTGIPDITTAAAIVHAADRRNAGINLDAWHWFRGRPSAEVLRGVADRIFVLQLDDADRDPVGPLAEDTCLRRRYPGEGGLDLVGLLMLCRDAGVEAPVSVEIMATDHHGLPVGEAARRAYDTTLRVIDRAWH